MKLSPAQRDALRTLLYQHDRHAGAIPQWVLELDGVHPATLLELAWKGALTPEGRLTEEGVKRARKIDRAWRRARRSA